MYAVHGPRRYSSKYPRMRVEDTSTLAASPRSQATAVGKSNNVTVATHNAKYATTTHPSTATSSVFQVMGHMVHGSAKLGPASPRPDRPSSARTPVFLMYRSGRGRRLYIRDLAIARREVGSGRGLASLAAQS